MPNIRRPGGTIDVARLGRAVSYPGIDPRLWCSLAVVTAVNVDPDHGPFVDVILLPSGMNACARVGAEMAGSGFGTWSPVRVDDEVVVIAPDGDPANGLIVARRLWSAADPPPQLMVDNPDDVLLQARDGTNVRIKATSGDLIEQAKDVSVTAVDQLTGDAKGVTLTAQQKLKGAALNIELEATADIKLQAPSIELVAPSVQVGGGGTSVLLGGSDATDALPKPTEFLAALDALISAIAAAVSGIAGQPGFSPIGTTAGTAITVAKTTFDAAVAASRSQIVKVK